VTRLLLALLPMLLPLPLLAEERDRNFTLQHDGVERQYRVHLPPGYGDRGAPLPVVIYLHGGGGGTVSAYLDGVHKSADQHGFLLAIPAATRIDKKPMSSRWNGGRWKGGECCGTADDIGFLAKMLDDLARRFRVDEQRVYAAGISNGGLMTHRVACELSERVAAVATVAPAAVPQDCAPVRPIPVMNIHGTKDPCNPFDGSDPKGFCARAGYKRMSPAEVVETWRKLDGCGETAVPGFRRGKASCTRYPDCRQGAEVAFCRVDGMGHAWPGGAQYFPAGLIGPVSEDISMNEIWTFFREHPLP